MAYRPDEPVRGLNDKAVLLDLTKQKEAHMAQQNLGLGQTWNKAGGGLDTLLQFAVPLFAIMRNLKALESEEARPGTLVGKLMGMQNNEPTGPIIGNESYGPMFERGGLFNEPFAQNSQQEAARGLGPWDKGSYVNMYEPPGAFRDANWNWNNITPTLANTPWGYGTIDGVGVEDAYYGDVRPEMPVAQEAWSGESTPVVHVDEVRNLDEATYDGGILDAIRTWEEATQQDDRGFVHLR